MAVSLEDLAEKTGNEKAAVLATALDEANSKFLNTNKSPSRKAGELDNRGSHFYLCMYWAQALAGQDRNADLSSKFGPVASQLEERESQIVDELNQVQGQSIDMGGYFRPDDAKVSAAMRPCAAFNEVLDSL